jgi:3-methyladenine DNA glycosylase AlkD
VYTDKSDMEKLRAALNAAAQPARVNHQKRVLGANRHYLGVDVPQMRRLARRFDALPLSDISHLLRSRTHEQRFVAVLILTLRHSSGSAGDQRDILDFFLGHVKWIDTWDLVDACAPAIVGSHLRDTDGRQLVDGLADSRDWWQRRMAVVSTLALVRRGDTHDSRRVAEMLLKDDHDLVQKAVGWILREVGRESKADLLTFLTRHGAATDARAWARATELLDSAQRRSLTAQRRARTHKLPKAIGPKGAHR